MDAPEATKPFSCTRTGRGGGAVPLPQEKDPGFCSTPDVTARALARVPRAGLSPKCPNASKSLASLNHRSLRCLPTPPPPPTLGWGALWGMKVRTRQRALRTGGVHADRSSDPTGDRDAQVYINLGRLQQKLSSFGQITPYVSSPFTKRLTTLVCRTGLPRNEGSK